ncbi:MAG: WecB/TagA/CpsF family glycosyltransferase [Leptonema sp. (in: bacteria)]
MGIESFVWEEKDSLLEYKSIDIKKLKKKFLLGVPIDDINREEAMAKILNFLEDQKKVRFVLFLDPIKLFQISHRKKYQKFLESDLILSEGKGLLWASKRLNQPIKERISLISFLMDLFRLAHKSKYTIYLLGSKQENIEKVYKNLSRNLPGIQIIGRQSGYFTKEWEEKIKESLKKCSPDIVLVGMGFPKQEKWIRENIDLFSYQNKKSKEKKYSIVIGVDNAFDILAGKTKVPEYFLLNGLQWLWRLIVKPYRLDNWWYFFQFYSLVLWQSLKIQKEK